MGKALGAAEHMQTWTRDQTYIRRCNLRSVMAALEANQPISRTEIAHLTGMSATSVTRIVTALLDRELLCEVGGEQKAGRGRRATSLRVNRSGLYSIGVHLKKSLVQLCVVDFTNQTLYRGEALVDGECTPERMAEAAKRLYDRIPDSVMPDASRIGAVGVCLSGAVDALRGVVSRSSQLGWHEEGVAAAFAEAFGLPACVENDVKACLIGEKALRRIPEETDAAYVLADEGLGAAITSLGILVRGERNEAGEIARIPGGRGADGEIEYLKDYLTEKYMVRRARLHDSTICSAADIAAAQRRGEAWAERIIEEFQSRLRFLLALIDGLCNPAQIMLGGAAFKKLEPYLSEILADGHVRMGRDYEETCLTGAALVAVRSAFFEMLEGDIE